ncbi:hypothetical protein [Escherichia phage Ecp_YSF]|nr:hypothetical protein [Escherichia phage Ecp_YSF]
MNIKYLILTLTISVVILTIVIGFANLLLLQAGI